MPDPDISPIPESSQLLSAAESLSGDDIDLPPVRETNLGDADSLWPTPRVASSKPSSSLKAMAAGAVIATLLAVGFFTWGNGSTEKQHPNWQHVASATDASSQTTTQLVAVKAGGAPQLLGHVQVSSADLNHAATKDVRTAIQNNDIAGATAAMQKHQQVSTEAQSDVQLTAISAGSQLAEELASGKKELFQIELFDCCDEDGDIVDVLVNGQLFATVPIMHAGTMLTIPLASGDNSIIVRGARDGGGGVTLSVRTSEGEFFTRYLWVGQECEIGMTVK